MIWRVILFWLLGANLAWADLPRRSFVPSVAFCKYYTALLNSNTGLMAYTNQDGQVTRYSRDGAGRVTNQANNLQQSNQFGFSALDDTISLTDGLGRNTSWQLNQYGWMTNKLNNLNASVQTNAFDANGQVTNRWLPATGSTAYKRDALGHATNIIYPGRTNILAAQSESTPSPK